MEVMVAFAEGDESSENMVARGVTVIEGLVAEPVGEGVDAERCLLDEEDTEDACVDESTEPVVPPKTCNERGEDEAHEEDNLEVVAMLPDNDRIFIQVADIGPPNSLGVLLHDHPTKVGVEETLANRVGILVGIGVSVMGTMISSPPSYGSFNRSTTNGSEKDPQRNCGGIGSMGPEAMISRRDPKACGELYQSQLPVVSGRGTTYVVQDSPDGSLPVEGRPGSLNEATYGDADDEKDVQPVHMFIEVALRNWLVSDVCFLRVVASAPIRFRCFRHWRWL